MYRKFYSYNDMPVVKKTPPAPEPPKKEIRTQATTGNGLFSGLENDDLILLAVFFILIMDNCEDRLLLLAIAFIFFSDYFNNPGNT
ncbi:MAG: hypothetical protein IJ300_05175 [Clostridia bacterium]|nr:hypothetical protein [Clostridia bacterium]